MRFAAAPTLAVCLLSLAGACGKSSHANPDAAGTAGAAGGAFGTAGTAGAASGTGGAGGMIGSATPLVDAFCAAARACCAKDGRPLDPLANCEANAAASFGAAQVSSGTIRIDGAAFDACVAAYQRAATSCTFTEAMTACRGIFVGTLASGATCTQVADCRRDGGPMVCVLIQVTSGVTPTTGTCAVAPRGSKGAACLASCPVGRDCSVTLLSGDPNPPLALCYEQDGLFCDSDQTCHPLNAPGADCLYDEGCGTGNFCLPGCEPILSAGATCQYDRSCGPGYTCASSKCAPAPLATDGTCEGYPQAPTF